MKKRIEKRNRQTLLSVYEEDLRSLESRIGKDRSASTWKAMLQGKTYVEKCLKEHFNMEDIAMKELTPQFIHDFSVYLSVERGLRGGTVWLACQQLKGVVTRAYQRGVLTWNPFAGFRLAKNIRPREYLTEGELKLLMDHEFEDKALTAYFCRTGTKQGNANRKSEPFAWTHQYHNDSNLCKNNNA